MRLVVVAAPAGDEDEGHQAAADAEREDDTERQRDPAMEADIDRVQAMKDPGRAGESQEQQDDEGGDKQSDFQS